MKLIKTTAEPSVEGLPGGHKIEYFGRINRTTFFVIHRPENNWSYDDFQVKIGPADNLKDITIKSVIRLRDGGTTIIETVNGQFFFPAPHKSKKRPKFRGKNIKIFSQ